MIIFVLGLLRREEKRGRKFYNFEGTELLARQIRLIEPETQSRSNLWCVRFILDVTQPKHTQTNAFYVEGILDANGNWLANFAEPTKNQPTMF